MYALNLPLSSEKHVFWERADPIRSGAGHAESATKTSADRPPGVSDSIEWHNGMACNQASDEERLLGKSAMQYPSMDGNVKRGVQKAVSRVMRAGKPQRLA